MVETQSAANSPPSPCPPAAPEPPPLDPKNEDRITFHMAEFSSLKSEIAELVKVATSNLQYALGLSGVIAAWMLKEAPRAGEDYLHFAFFLPLVLSLVFAMHALAAYGRIGVKASYLREIEDRLRAERLGWERRFKARFRTLGWLHVAAWLLLIVGDGFVASFAFR